MDCCRSFSQFHYRNANQKSYCWTILYSNPNSRSIRKILEYRRNYYKISQSFTGRIEMRRIIQENGILNKHRKICSQLISKGKYFFRRLINRSAKKTFLHETITKSGCTIKARLFKVHERIQSIRTMIQISNEAMDTTDVFYLPHHAVIKSESHHQGQSGI